MNPLIFVASIIVVRLAIGLVFIKTGIGQDIVTSQVVEAFMETLTIYGLVVALTPLFANLFV
ncbi:hypothetical protein BDL97_17G009800 [Sphagnum fallax]|nr:hypothetical protein BDL97_17G009800 [Sphagnum fallax]